MASGKPGQRLFAEVTVAAAGSLSPVGNTNALTNRPPGTASLSSRGRGTLERRSTDSPGRGGPGNSSARTRRDDRSPISAPTNAHGMATHPYRSSEHRRHSAGVEHQLLVALPKQEAIGERGVADQTDDLSSAPPREERRNQRERPDEETPAHRTTLDRLTAPDQ